MYQTTRSCKKCGKIFIPEYGRQVFCCVKCRESYHNTTNRAKKSANQSSLSLEQTRQALSSKTHLSITDAAKYLDVTRPTVYARIRDGELVPVRFGTRTLRIPIEQLLESTKRTTPPSKGDFSSVISKEEALVRYDITDAWLYKKLKAEGIRPKIMKGKSYFPRKDLDKLFPPKVTYNPEDWYNAYDLMASEGFTRKFITEFTRRKGVTTRRVGRALLIKKDEWDTARLFRGDIEKNYMTVDQAKKQYHLANKTFYDGINNNGIQGIRQGNYVYFKISDLDRLFKDKTPKIPAGIRQNYMRGVDALKHYHIGQKRFTEETRAAGVEKIRTEGNYVWYKKDDLDRLFKKITDHESH